MIKELQVDIPDWCEGCQSFDIFMKIEKGTKIFTCHNLDYCKKQKQAFERYQEEVKAGVAT